jgi:hypothetical protein
MLVSHVQNGGLVSVACTAMADMAYIIPDLVLPLVHERFEARAHPCSAPSFAYPSHQSWYEHHQGSSHVA